MTDERRYQEREIQEIFKRAASQEELGSTGHDLTLAELQEIGHGVGLEPSRIADAVRAHLLRKARHVGEVVVYYSANGRRAKPG